MSSSTASWSRHGAVPPYSPPPPAPAPILEPNGDAADPALPSSSSPPPPTATAAEAGVAFFSRAGASASAAAAVGRPRAWREALDATAFARPESCGEARARARRNLAYFRANYALAALLLVFLGLVYRPASMLAFLALFVAWLALYFGRAGDRLACLGREVDDRLVLAALAAATVLAVALTRAGLNLLVSLVLAAAIIGVHAAFRMNVYLDETDAFDAAVSSFTGSPYGYSALPR
ncbi:PRA1 family protein E-like [Lolium rigidum]|uniref:PRA1 family protein E-like n=1 Tax=Lolium rigidum TaxID=89674 RepID=UPI001F5DE871|nr:PRA1 family protein E-like [Lolium rigidum]